MDVRVSPAECIDAHRAVAVVGYGDRTLLKDALCVTLAKTAEEVDRFDTAFDTFFTRDREFTAPPPPAGPPAGRRERSGAPLADMLLENDAVGLAQAMEAARRCGIQNIRLFTQRSLSRAASWTTWACARWSSDTEALRDAGDEPMAERLGTASRRCATRRAPGRAQPAALRPRRDRTVREE